MLAVLSLLLAMGGPQAKAESSDEEYRVKAAFIFHFAQLVDWPAESQTNGANPLVLCTLGDDPFQGALETTLAGKTIGNRVMLIRHLADSQAVHACQMVFLGKSLSKRIPALIAGLRNAPILTIGETDGFLNDGGMICFLLEENKVRFEINLNAAESSGFKVGSRLLILAERVVGESSGK